MRRYEDKRRTKLGGNQKGEPDSNIEPAEFPRWVRAALSNPPRLSRKINRENILSENVSTAERRTTRGKERGDDKNASTSQFGNLMRSSKQMRALDSSPWCWGINKITDELGRKLEDEGTLFGNNWWAWKYRPWNEELKHDNMDFVTRFEGI